MQNNNCHLPMTEENKVTSGMEYIIQEYGKDWKELEIIKAQMESLDISLFANNMKEYKQWCSQNDQQAFFNFFRDAAYGALYRYLVAKEKAWSWKSTIIPVICAGAPAFLGSAVSLWNKTSENSFLLPTAILSVVIAVVAFSYVYSELRTKRNYYETWVRHSACFYRLSLELSRFILSPKADVDFNTLKKKTFAILNQNLDQFTLNMSSNGLAEKAED